MQRIIVRNRLITLIRNCEELSSVTMDQMNQQPMNQQ